MRKHKGTRVQLSRHDIWRALLTDTTPAEVPIIVCNEGFYKNVSDFWQRSSNYRKFVGLLVFGKNLGSDDFDNIGSIEREQILRKDVDKFTIPYRYAVSRGGGEFRTLSLVHPLGQVQIARFYHSYDHLICEYAGRSGYSIRKPIKIGNAFALASESPYFAKFRKAIVMSKINIDGIAQSPSSYFVYSGYDRLYRFFQSKDHRRLEKKFRFRLALDIGRCFDSIYTHSVTWATLSKHVAKMHIQSSNFGNSFDKVMRQLNYNETSGICVGPETSRIFAEIILARIDRLLEARLSKREIEAHSNYECRRYVDNYYFFANDEDTLKAIEIELGYCLNEFKLHLNLEKTETMERPFYSNVSRVIDSANSAVQRLRRNVLAESGQPRRIQRSEAIVHEFLKEIKSACHGSGVSFDVISNFVVGCMWRSTCTVADMNLVLYNDAKDKKDELHACHREFYMLVLDLCFWFFTIRPTTGASMQMARIIVRIGQVLDECDAEGLDIIREFVFTLVYGLSKSDEFRKIDKRFPIVPIELLNILLSIEELGGRQMLTAELFWHVWELCEDKNYFLIVVGLYVFRDKIAFEDKQKLLLTAAENRLRTSDNFFIDSELVHLLLDLLSCPFVDKLWKKTQLKRLWPELKEMSPDLGDIEMRDLGKLISEFEAQYWFVRWDGVRFQDLLEKKMLKTVY